MFTPPEASRPVVPKLAGSALLLLDGAAAAATEEDPVAAVEERAAAPAPTVPAVAGDPGPSVVAFATPLLPLR